MTARAAKHFSVIRSVSDFGRATGDHHAGYYYNLTGHTPDQTFRTEGNSRRPYSTDWPFMGSAIASRRPAHPKFPKLISLPQRPGLHDGRPGQFAGKLGLEHDPFYLKGDELEPIQFSAPSLSLEGMSVKRLDSRVDLLNAVNQARRQFDHEAAIANYTKQQEKAFDLLSSPGSTPAFDLQSTQLRHSFIPFQLAPGRNASVRSKTCITVEVEAYHARIGAASQQSIFNKSKSAFVSCFCMASNNAIVNRLVVSAGEIPMTGT